MTEHNKRVIETLNRYIGVGEPDTPAPHYAIMLIGEWGCGKTYFVSEKWIKGISETDKEKLSIISVSLFGLKCVEELNYEIAHSKVILKEVFDKNKKTNGFFSRAKKIKESKVFKGISAIVNKATDSNFGIKISDITGIFTRDWLSENKKDITKVLILDDLERAKMDLKEIFGFISSYIESTSIRVVFISNDSEINITHKSHSTENIKTEKIISKTSTEISEENIETRLEVTQDEDYTKIREKIIGETLKIETDVDDAIAYFLKEMNYSVEEREEFTLLIKDVREKLEYENLRIIRQTLIKLHPLIEAVKDVEAYKNYQYEEIEISGKRQKKQYYLHNMAQIFMVANMQKVMGQLQINEVALAYSAFKNDGISAVQLKEKDKSKQKKEGRDYFELSLTLAMDGWNVYIPLKEDTGFGVWESYIWNGELDMELIKNLVTQDIIDITPDMYKPQNTLFLLLKGYWDFTKEQFSEYLNKLVNELEEGLYTEIVELVTAYSVFKDFEKWNILEGVKDVESFFDKILKQVSLEYNIILNKYGDDIKELYLSDITYKGYQVDSHIARDKVVAFLEKLKDQYRGMKDSTYKSDIVTSVELVTSGLLDADEFYKALRYRTVDGATNKFVWHPALEWIGAEKLFGMLDRLTMIEQRRLFSTLKLRYGHNESGVKERYLVYESEKSVLLALVQGYRDRFERAKQEGDNKVSMYSYLTSDSEETLDVFTPLLNGSCH